MFKKLFIQNQGTVQDLKCEKKIDPYMKDFHVNHELIVGAHVCKLKMN